MMVNRSSCSARHRCSIRHDQPATTTRRRTFRRHLPDHGGGRIRRGRGADLCHPASQPGASRAGRASLVCRHCPARAGHAGNRGNRRLPGHRQSDPVRFQHVRCRAAARKSRKAAPATASTRCRPPPSKAISIRLYSCAAPRADRPLTWMNHEQVASFDLDFPQAFFDWSCSDNNACNGTTSGGMCCRPLPVRRGQARYGNVFTVEAPGVDQAPVVGPGGGNANSRWWRTRDALD